MKDLRDLKRVVGGVATRELLSKIHSPFPYTSIPPPPPSYPSQYFGLKYPELRPLPYSAVQRKGNTIKGLTCSPQSHVRIPDMAVLNLPN